MSTIPRAADAVYTIYQDDGSSEEHAARWYENGHITLLLPRGQGGKAREVSYDAAATELIQQAERKCGISGISIHLARAPEVHSEVSVNPNELGHYTNGDAIREFFGAEPARRAGLRS